VSHRDVGIGVSQVLPVLVQAYAANHGLIAMEQPEIHLHPALQAELGDVFIESALGKQQNRFVLETHSEHLILRILRRIRESAKQAKPTITASDVAVLYVEPSPDGAEVYEMEISKDGQIVSQWPGGFFPERMKEMFGGDMK
jgi:predicted ATPase